ncbi:hypothetical protein, partial [Victivallis lenta]|uniref:hypothetical protein n=1 Tax=Victivallis lenta TaxID=2606640 RepID=UPI003AF229B8
GRNGVSTTGQTPAAWLMGEIIFQVPFDCVRYVNYSESGREKQYGSVCKKNKSFCIFYKDIRLESENEEKRNIICKIT